MLYDRAKIFIKAGDGGNGSASFRREKFVPYGGPDGGDGGRGGSVFLIVDVGLNTLLPFKFKTHYKGESGGNGGKQQMHGKAGEDLYIKVPPGTIFYTEPNPDEPDEVPMQGDLTTPGQSIMIARAGRGGLGNTHFKTSTHQAPKMAQKGEPGEERWFRLELKLIADVGLVGFPNAGKSSLLTAVTAATPKIGDYPFTTLQPNLGVVRIDTDTAFVVADIPGLIEGASQGVGLGHEFLRHVERTRLIIHIIDASGQADRDPIKDYEQINHELAEYRPELADKPQVVVINKIDMPETQENLPRLRKYFRGKDLEFYEISAIGMLGTDTLMKKVAARLASLPPQQPLIKMDSDDMPVLKASTLDQDAFQVLKLEEGRFRVRGKRIERVISMTDVDNEEAMERLQIVFDRTGISRALEQAGVKGGDMVQFGRVELEWQEQW